MLQYQVLETRVSIRSEPHDLVLSAIDLETGVVGESRVQQSKRMGKAHFLDHLQVASATNGDRPGCPFANTVKCQHHRFFKRGRVESTGSMTQVVFCKQKLVRVRKSAIVLFQVLQKHRLLEQFLLQPNRHCQPERRKTPRCEGNVGLQKPFKLQERLVVKHDMINVRDLQTRFRKDIINSVARVARIMFLSCEAFLLRGSHNLSVTHQRCSTVVVESGNTQNCGHQKIV